MITPQMYVVIGDVAFVIVGTSGPMLVVIVGNEHPMSPRLFQWDTKETW